MSVTFKQLKASTHCLVQWFLRDNFKSSELLSRDKVPELHREPYIYSGYRPVFKPWKYYVHSILHLHNESMNIWTHMIGFVAILYHLVNFLADYDVFTDKIAWPVLVYGACCLCSMLLSSTAHLLHSKSPCHHYILFMLDYGAVALYGFGVGLGSMYVSSAMAFREAFHPWYLPANVLCSWFAFYTFCMAKTRVSSDIGRRKGLMVLGCVMQGIFLLMPVLPRYTDCLRCDTCHMTSMNHVTFVLLLDVLCGVSYGAFLPERLLPGRFDIFGHSHQIFHVVAVFAMISKFSAMKIDIDTLNISQEVFPTLPTICLSFFVLIFLDVLTYLYFVNYIMFSSGKRKSKKRVK